jgi:hypothetical protein
MLVACRLAGLSALEGHYAGVRVCAQFGGACGCAARLQRLVQMAAKIRRLARNSKLGDDGGSGSSRFPANRTYRVSVFDLAISAFLLGAHGLTSLASAGITPGLYAFRLGGGTKSAATFRA